MNAGSPRITVAFPLSKISMGAEAQALSTVAELLGRLAREVADLAREAQVGDADALDAIAAQTDAAVREIAGH